MTLSIRQVLSRAGVTTHKHIVSLLYFLTFAALACNGRFMAIFFRDDLGLSSGDIGFVLACGTFVGLFSTPTWSVYASMQLCHTICIAVCLFRVLVCTLTIVTLCKCICTYQNALVVDVCSFCWLVFCLSICLHVYVCSFVCTCCISPCMCVYPNRSALCDYLGEKRTTLVVTVAGGAVAALLYLVPLATAAVPHQPCLQQAHTLSRIQYGRMHTHTDTHAHKHTLMNVRIHVCTHTHTHVCTHPKRTHCTHAPPERTHCTRATRSTHKCTLAHTSVQLWEAL